MLSAFGAALALAYAAVPFLPASVALVAAAVQAPAIALALARRRLPPAVMTVVQLPVSIGMFTLLRRLAHGDVGAIPATSRLAAALRAGHALHVGGVDLATTGFAAVAAGPGSIAAVAVVLALATVLVLAARRPDAPVLLTLLPATSALLLPLVVTVFVASASVLRAASGRLLS